LFSDTVDDEDDSEPYDYIPYLKF